LEGVTNGSYRAACTYLANAPLVSQNSFRSNTVTRMTTTRSYDFLNRMTDIASRIGVATVSISAYAYNAANQRTAHTIADNARWVYTYDDLGQVISGKKYWSDGTPVAGQQFEYGFDDIGNRKQIKAGGDENGAENPCGNLFTVNCK
jgi:YD repeat-containing protein